LPREVHGRYLEDKLIHRTADGTLVRSKGEVIVADALHAHGVAYEYEAPFIGADGTQRLPDFTIDDATTGNTIIWEHLGMLTSPSYRRSWERKLAWYSGNGVKTAEDGGGSRATLVVTMDDPAGGIDSAHVHRLIETLLG
jgi:hypothetical protein